MRLIAASGTGVRLSGLFFVSLILIVTPQLSAEPKTVRVGYLPATHDSLLFVARELNYFDQSKISVDLQSFDNSVQIMSALKNGQIDIGIPGVATPANDIGGKAPLSIVGGAAARSAAIVAKPEIAKELRQLTSLASKMKYFRGKRIGAVRGSTGLAILREGFARHRISEKSLTLIDYQKPPDIVNDVQAGNLDLGLLWSPHMTVAEGKGLAIGMWMTEILPNHVCCRQIARDAFLEDETAIVEYLVGILKADRAVRRAQSNPAMKQQVFRAVKRYLVTLSDSQIEQELFAKNARTTLSPDIDARGIDKYLQAMETVNFMRPDQCDHVRSKIKTAYLQKAFERMGCSRTAAAECLQRGAAACPCAQ